MRLYNKCFESDVGRCTATLAGDNYECHGNISGGKAGNKLGSKAGRQADKYIGR